MTARAQPIPFSAPMVRALLAGKKTQTRRIVKPQPIAGTDALRDIPGENRWWAAYAGKDPTGVTYRPLGSDQQHDWRCPYGMRGDLLWVREPWRVGKPHDHKRPSEILGPLVKRGKGVTVLYEAGGWRSVGPADRVEPIYLDDEPMPKWAGKYRHARFMPRWASRLTLRITEIRVERLQEISEADAIAEGRSLTPGDARGYFPETWESINGAGSWAANPWVWAVSFEVITRNVEHVTAAA